MTVSFEKFTILSNGNGDIIDITSKLQNIIQTSDSDNFLINIYTNSPYVSIISADFEIQNADFKKLLDSIYPLKIELNENKIQYSPDTFANIRASILGRSLTIPVINKKIELPNQEKVFLVDFSIQSSSYDVIIGLIK